MISLEAFDAVDEELEDREALEALLRAYGFGRRQGRNRIRNRRLKPRETAEPLDELRTLVAVHCGDPLAGVRQGFAYYGLGVFVEFDAANQEPIQGLHGAARRARKPLAEDRRTLFYRDAHPSPAPDPPVATYTLDPPIVRIVPGRYEAEIEAVPGVWRRYVIDVDGSFREVR